MCSHHTGILAKPSRTVAEKAEHQALLRPLYTAPGLSNPSNSVFGGTGAFSCD